MQVKNLEEELGVILLDRSKKPVIPTEAGTLVLNQAREAVMAFRRVTEAVNDLKGEVSGLLRLGVIPTIAPYLLHRFVPEFTRKYPKVELQIKEMVTADIVAALNRDMLECRDSGRRYLPRRNYRGGVVRRPGFTPMSRRCIRCTSACNIRIEDIDVKHLLLLSEGNCLRDQVLELCQARRQGPGPVCF